MRGHRQCADDPRVLLDRSGHHCFETLPTEHLEAVLAGLVILDDDQPALGERPSDGTSSLRIRAMNGSTSASTRVPRRGSDASDRRDPGAAGSPSRRR